MVSGFEIEAFGGGKREVRNFFKMTVTASFNHVTSLDWRKILDHEKRKQKNPLLSMI